MFFQQLCRVDSGSFNGHAREIPVVLRGADCAIGGMFGVPFGDPFVGGLQTLPAQADARVFIFRSLRLN